MKKHYKKKVSAIVLIALFIFGSMKLAVYQYLGGDNLSIKCRQIVTSAEVNVTSGISVIWRQANPFIKPCSFSNKHTYSLTKIS